MIFFWKGWKFFVTKKNEKKKKRFLRGYSKGGEEKKDMPSEREKYKLISGDFERRSKGENDRVSWKGSNKIEIDTLRRWIEQKFVIRVYFYPKIETEIGFADTRKNGGKRGTVKALLRSFHITSQKPRDFLFLINPCKSNKSPQTRKEKRLLNASRASETVNIFLNARIGISVFLFFFWWGRCVGRTGGKRRICELYSLIRFPIYRTPAVGEWKPERSAEYATFD